MTYTSNDGFYQVLWECIMTGGTVGTAFSLLITPVFVTIMAGNAADVLFNEWKKMREVRANLEMEKIRQETEEIKKATEEARKATEEIRRLSKLD